MKKNVSSAIHVLRRAASVALVAAVAAAGFTVGAAAPPAWAGSGPFITNWPGEPDLQYSYQGTVIGKDLQKLAPSKVPAMASLFNSAWAANEATVCGTIHDKLVAYLGSFEQWVCDLPSGGTLGAQLLGPNSVSLDYQIDHIATSLDVEKDGDWATVNATFNAQFHLTLDLENSIEAGQPSSSVSLGPSEITFSNADVSSANVLLHIFAPDLLSDAQSWLDGYVISGAAGLLGLGPDITSVNNDLNSLATFMAAFYVKPSYPHATDVTFGLSADVSPDNLIITYSMNPPEPVPAGCTAWGTGADPYASSGPSVEATCSPDQPHAVNWVVLQQHDSGGWATAPAYTLGFQNGYHLKVNGSKLYAETPGTNVPGWFPNDGSYGEGVPDSGPDLTCGGSSDPCGAFMVDPLATGPTNEMRVCSEDKWALDCDAAVSVSQPSSSGGGGGGGGGGGSVPPGPPTSVPHANTHT